MQLTNRGWFVLTLFLCTLTFILTMLFVPVIGYF